MPKRLTFYSVLRIFTLSLLYPKWRTLGILLYLLHLLCFKKIHAKGGKYE